MNVTTKALSESRLRDHPALLAATVLAPLCEAVPLRYFHVIAGLAPQLTAPTPFAAFHDVRWLAVFHNSWRSFVLDLSLLLLARSLFHAAMVRAAWPRGRPPPSFGVAWRLAAAYTAVVVVVVWPSATLVFAGGATSLSWLPIAALPLFLLVALLSSHGGYTKRWWYELPPARVAGWTLLTFVELSLASAAILLGPWWLAWLSAGLAGLFNAWAWTGLVSAAASVRPSHRVIPRAVVGFVVLFTAATALTVWQIGGLVHQRSVHVPSTETMSAASEIPVLIVNGWDSNWKGAPLAGRDGFLFVPFSYAGMDATGYPLTYGPRSTHASIAYLEQLMDRQTRALAAKTRQRVRIIATSEGTVVARSYLEAFPRAPVSDLVMISPLVEPGRVFYPRDGSSGWGVATRAAMRGLAAVLGSLSGTDLDPNMPFLRSIVDHAPALRRGALCPAPQARVVAILPTASAAVVPPAGLSPRVPVRIVRGFHGAGFSEALSYLVTGALPHTPRGAGMLNKVLRAGATAWMVPELPVSLNPAWKMPAFDREGCPVSGWPLPAH